MPYVGGCGTYRQECDEVAADGYHGFAPGKSEPARRRAGRMSDMPGVIRRSMAPVDPCGQTALSPTCASRGIDTVILGGADTHGIMRGKRVPIGQLATLLEHGMPMCDVFWVINVDESELVPRPAGHSGYFPTERNGYPDILAIPDLATLREVPWHEDTALILCDFHRQDRCPDPDLAADRPATGRRARPRDGVRAAVRARVRVLRPA